MILLLNLPLIMGTALFVALLAMLLTLIFGNKVVKANIEASKGAAEATRLLNKTNKYMEGGAAHSLNGVVMDLVNKNLGNSFSNFKVSSSIPWNKFLDLLKANFSVIQEYSGVSKPYATYIVYVEKGNEKAVLKVETVKIETKDSSGFQQYQLMMGNEVLETEQQIEILRNLVIYHRLGESIYTQIVYLAEKYRVQHRTRPVVKTKINIKSLYMGPTGIQFVNREDKPLHKTDDDINMFYDEVEIRIGNKMHRVALSKVFGILQEMLAHGQSLVIGGNPGTGKTQLAGYLMSSIIKELPGINIYDIPINLFQNAQFRATWRSFIFRNTPSQKDSDESTYTSNLLFIDQAEKAIDYDPSTLAEMSSNLDSAKKLALIMVYNGSIGVEGGNDVKRALLRPGRSGHFIILPLRAEKAVKAARYHAANIGGKVNETLLNTVISTDSETSASGYATLAEVIACVETVDKSGGFDAMLAQAVKE